MSGKPKPQGWARPANSRKYHYFVGAMALCHRWAFLAPDLDDTNDDHAENCAACKREIVKLRKQEVQP